MSKILRICFALSLISMVFGFSNRALAVTAAPEAGITLPTQAIPYAPDFATNEFHDAWDMSEFTDISQYLNGSGRHVSLSKPTVANGLFSATTLGDHNKNLGYFYILFPDYPTMSRTGKLGVLHPIKTSQYSCLYISMKVNSSTWKADGTGDPFWDSFRVMWYKNDNMLPQGEAPNGGTRPIIMHFDPDQQYQDPYPTRLQKVFKVDLTNPPDGFYGVRWQDAAEWQGLEINPSMFSNVSFDVDWIKLTNHCGAEAAYQAPIRFTPSSAINSVWVNPVGTTRNIRVAIDVNGASGQYNFDTKGLAAGKYKVGLGDRVNCCSQWSTTELTITAPARLSLLRPSATSGPEYGAAAGNPWDMEPTDVKSYQCTSASFASGLLSLTTQYPANLPASCRGSSLGESDPQLFLNSPLSVPPNSGYRYLSFRLYQSGAWQYVADGMMVRWMWRTPDGCTFVGNDIPLDVGWNTYTIDLYEPINGTPLMVTAPCSQLTPWKNAPTISAFRLDPNENYTGMVPGVPPTIFEQQIDWIKLTKPDQVKAGSPYMIEYQTDRAVPATAVTFYYTSDPATPKQHTAEVWLPSLAPTVGKRFFMPLVQSATGTALAPGVVRYQWNTTGVAPGQYTICAEVNDAGGKTLQCSNALIQVTP